MFDIDKLSLILHALPDPAFVLSRSGKYVEVFGGKDNRYYHDGSNLIGLSIPDLIKPDKANWFLTKIDEALQSKKLLIEEYELSNKDVKGLSDTGPDEPIWFEGRIQALDFLVDGEEVVLWVSSNITERYKLEIELRKLSDTDQLTELFNRRKLLEDLNINYKKYVRDSISTSILTFDLDNLKQINDTYGHHVGDKVLLSVAKVCHEKLRKTDIPCRSGGDEFVIILPNTDLEYAVVFAEKLRKEFNQVLKPFIVNEKSITVSIGVSEFLATDTSFENAIIRADEALYKAKKSGKNTVMFS